MGLAFLAWALLSDDDDVVEVAIEAELAERRIDLIEPVASAELSDGFQIGPDGITVGSAQLRLDDLRVLPVVPGTPGEIACPDLAAANACAVFADMLGDAVVWFAIVPQASPSTVELPPIVDLDEGNAVFENGWRLPYAAVIERECPDEIATFSEFLRHYGPHSVSIVDLEAREVVAVRCGAPVGQ